MKDRIPWDWRDSLGSLIPHILVVLLIMAVELGT